MRKSETIAIVIIGREINIRLTIKKRSYQPMYKTENLNEAKSFKATTFAMARLITKWGAKVKNTI